MITWDANGTDIERQGYTSSFAPNPTYLDAGVGELPPDVSFWDSGVGDITAGIDYYQNRDGEFPG